MKRFLFVGMFFLTLCLSGCATGGNKLTERGSFAFDTYISITDEEHPDVYYHTLFTTIEHLESLMSVTVDDSDISRLNREKKLVPSEEVYEIINKAVEASKLTGGAFDITAYPYVTAWGFTTDRYRIPGKEELESISGSVGYENIELSDGKVILKNNASIDLGGIAKGYVGDYIAKIKGEESALISFGGNIRVTNRKPDGSLWKIGIKDPKNPSKILGYVSVEDTNIVTSGGYERYFCGDDGAVYCHIIDPSTGMPVQNGILSVTVIGKDGAMCDAFSTGLFVMGEMKAKEFYKNNSDYEIVIVTEDDRILISEGLTDSFVKDKDDERQQEVILKN